MLIRMSTCLDTKKPLHYQQRWWVSMERLIRWQHAYIPSAVGKELWSEHHIRHCISSLKASKDGATAGIQTNLYQWTKWEHQAGEFVLDYFPQSLHLNQPRNVLYFRTNSSRNALKIEKQTKWAYRQIPQTATFLNWCRSTICILSQWHWCQCKRTCSTPSKDTSCYLWADSNLLRRSKCHSPAHKHHQ